MKHDLSKYFGFNKQTIHNEWIDKSKIKSKEFINGKWVIECVDGNKYTGEAIQELSKFIIIKTITKS